MEIGCGSGGILAYLKENGFKVRGFDLDPNKIEQGKKYLSELECQDALKVEIDYGAYSYILLSNVLEHLANPLKMMELLYERVTESNCIIIDVPNFEHIDEYSNKIENFFHIGHLWYFSPQTLETLLDKVGFFIEYIDLRGSAMTVICRKKTNATISNAWILQEAYLHHAEKNLDVNNDSKEIKYESSRILSKKFKRKKATEIGKQMSDKHLTLFLLMNQWVKVKQEGKNLSSYFMANGYKKIAVYGMSYMGETLVEELKESGVEVAYGIDKNADRIYADIDVVSINDELKEVDAVVITAVTFFDEISTQLREKVSCPIISLEDVLYKV